MAKTNFTKVEEALTAGLIKMAVSDLYKLSDISKALGDKSSLAPMDDQKNRLLIAALQFDLKLLRDTQLCRQLELSQKEIKEALSHPSTLTPEQWHWLREVKVKIDQYKKSQEEHIPQENEQIVEAERKKHINKRFNVRDKWLPLH